MRIPLRIRWRVFQRLHDTRECWLCALRGALGPLPICILEAADLRHSGVSVWLEHEARALAAALYPDMDTSVMIRHLIPHIKSVRIITGWGLKESKLFVETWPEFRK